MLSSAASNYKSFSAQADGNTAIFGSLPGQRRARFRDPNVAVRPLSKVRLGPRAPGRDHSGQGRVWQPRPVSIPRLIGRETAVGWNDRTGDHSRLVGGQEQRDAGDILRFAHRERIAPELRLDCLGLRTARIRIVGIAKALARSGGESVSQEGNETPERVVQPYRLLPRPGGAWSRGRGRDDL
jgi:hypothetical protein